MISLSLQAELAPTGKIRAGINYGNPVLASRDSDTGELRGVAVDLARELGRRVEQPVALLGFDSAGKLFDALKAGVWDIAFLAVDPARAAEIDFTAPYLEIEGTYLVPPGSRVGGLGEVDRVGIRIGVSSKSAYDLFLSRTIKQAELVRAAGPDTAFGLLLEGQVDVVAGVRQHLDQNAVKLPGSRVFAGRFMAIEQALGIRRGRLEGAKYLRAYIEDVKASGFVRRALERAGVRGVTVAAPSAPE